MPKKKIILDLCGGTGSWSLPYKEAGFEVFNVTLPEWNVKQVSVDRYLLNFSGKRIVDARSVYGILAAPPCDQFSFARTKAKLPRDLEGGMETVSACLKIIWFCQRQLDKDTQKYPPLKFWALENPYYSMTRWFLGKPAFIFNPYDFGHNYQKRTAVWGYFNEPKKSPVEMTRDQKEKEKTNSQDLPKFDYMKSKDIAPEWFGKLTRKERRAITPKGFAKAFFEANQ